LVCEDLHVETSVELITAPGLATAPYSYAAVMRGASNIIFTASACPLDEDGHTVAVGDFAGQAEQVMVNLKAALLAAGADLTDVVKTTVCVASATRDDLVTAWDVVHRYFGDHQVPSTLLGVATLGYPDQLVEVDAVAVRRSSCSRR